MLFCYHLVMQVQVLTNLTLHLSWSVLWTTTYIRLEIGLPSNGVKVFIISVMSSCIGSTLDVTMTIHLRLFGCYPRFSSTHATYSIWRP